MNPMLLQGLLAQPNDPEALATANRAQGIATGFRAPTSPSPPAGLSVPQIQQIYGLLAENAENPTALMGNYIGDVQQQQQIDRQNTPMAQMLQIYGKVNPHDWSAESLQRFHSNWIKTGNMQFDLLEPKEGLSTTEEKAILDANTAYQAAQGKSMEIGNLIGRYEDAIRKGGYTQGVMGAASTWIAENITGNVDQYDALKKDFSRLVNTGIINNLPPGVASDRDIAIVAKGFPGPNADPAYLLSFLRGMQKLEVMNAAKNYHTAHFLGITKSPERLAQNWSETREEMYLRALYDAGLDIVRLREGETPEQAATRALRSYDSMTEEPSIAPYRDAEKYRQTPMPAAGGTKGIQDATVDELLNMKF